MQSADWIKIIDEVGGWGVVLTGVYMGLDALRVIVSTLMIRGR